ncbi:MAG: ATP-binding cassette domain-containing protein, partial [Alphaproteobacteria bacterium]|nr:ATP-binding cassette domain-containing protein [Alphaproteobacteria bacterium]
TNIALHAPHSGDEELVRAARQSGALEWINQRAAGFDAPVGERGDGLSGGQRQSVALARAFLRDPPVLLLDEPTSDMDAMSERVFIEQMKGAAADKTIIVVTHKPALLELVDRLIVLDRNGVQADGPKDKVMAALQRRSAEKKASTAAAAPLPEGETVPTSETSSDELTQAASGQSD